MFESVKITTLLNGASAVIGAREDLAQADAVTLALTDNTGVSSYRWEIIGRPEYSVAGGAGGPSPWLLGTGATASFTVDSDSGSVHLDGTYEVWCIVNIDTPTETRIRVLLARKTALTIPALGGGTRSLRKLGMFEQLDDTISILNVLGGWSTMMNRWLEYLTGVGGGGGGFPGYGVVGNLSQIDIGDAAVAGALATVSRADHQHPFPAPILVVDVLSAGVIGSSPRAAREDHAHKGVHSVNGQFGDVVTDTFPGYGLAGSLSQIDIGDTAVAGVATTLARADHQHPFPVPTVINPVAPTSALGSSTKAAREDHAHAGVHTVNGLSGDVVLASTFPGYGVAGDLSQIDVGDAAAAGGLAVVARADHQHPLPVPTVINDVGAANALGASAKVAREDHVHKGVHSVNGLFGDVTISPSSFPGYGIAGDLAAIDIGDAAAAGVLLTVARADHQHAMAVPTVINDVAASSALGSSAKAAREDHSHKGVHSVNGQFGDVTIASSFPGYGVVGDLTAIDIGDTANAGSLATVARVDHQHAMAAPIVVVDVLSAGTLGSSPRAAREDHAHKGVHSVNGQFGDVVISVSSFPGYGVAGDLSQIDVGDAAAAGGLAVVARADHQHPLPVPIVVVDIAGSGVIGSSPRVAREDHTHKGVHSVNGLFGDVTIASSFPGYGISSDLSTLDIGDAASGGALTAVARADHQHAFASPIVVIDILSSGTLGSSPRAAREDHSHKGVHSVNGQFGDVLVPATTATWLAGLCRYWLIDYDGGNDLNDGFVDAAPGSTIAPAGHALKTIERFLQLFPRIGLDRLTAVLVKGRAGGAVYRNMANTADDAIVLTSTLGYQKIVVRSSLDLTNSAADRGSLSANQMATGPNGDGSYTAAVGGTNNFLISSGTLPTDFNGGGFRLRWVTGAQAGQSMPILQILGGNTVICGRPFPGAAAGGDHFVLEKPGAAVDHIYIGVFDSNEVSVEVAGFECRAATDGFKVGVGSGEVRAAFMNVLNTGNNIVTTQSSGGAAGAIIFSQLYADEAGTAHNVGGVRFSGSCLFRGCAGPVVVDGAAFMATGGRSFDYLNGVKLQIGLGASCVFNSGILVTGCVGGAADSNNFAGVEIGTVAGFAALPRCRVIGPNSIIAGIWLAGNGGVTINGMSISGMGALPCIFVTGVRTSLYLKNVDSAAGGNANVGIDFANAIDSLLVVESGVTVSGTGGELLLGGSVPALFADLDVCNIVDPAKGSMAMSFTTGVLTKRPAVKILNAAGSTLAPGTALKYTGSGATGNVVQADASSLTGNRVDGFLLTTTINSGVGYMLPATDVVIGDFLSTPTVGDRVFLTNTPGRLSTTPTNPFNAPLPIGTVSGAALGSSGGHFYWRVLCGVGVDPEVTMYRVEPSGTINPGEQVRVYHAGGGFGVALTQEGNGSYFGWVGTALDFGTDGQYVRVARSGIRRVKLANGLSPLTSDTLWQHVSINGLATTQDPFTTGDPPLERYPVGVVIDPSGYVSVSNPYVLAQVIPLVYEFPWWGFTP
jgi:hypothetical protein